MLPERLDIPNSSGNTIIQVDQGCWVHLSTMARAARIVMQVYKAYVCPDHLLLGLKGFTAAGSFRMKVNRANLLDE